MPSLLGHVLINRTLPGKKQILSSAVNVAKSVLRNPIRAVRNGIARDRLAVNTYRNLTGKNRLQATGNLAKVVGSGVYNGGGKDLLVNTGGAIGSAVGSSGGLAGGLAGDWAGAAVARKGLDRTEASVKAGLIKSNPRFQQQPKPIQQQIIAKRQQGFRKSLNKNFGGELKQDTVGWGIGNASAHALRAGGSKVPLQGGMVAMATVPSVMKGIRVGTRAGIKKGLVSTQRGIRKAINPLRQIKKGLRRERTMINSVNTKLQSKLPKLPEGTDFKRNIYFLADFNY